MEKKLRVKIFSQSENFISILGLLSNIKNSNIEIDITDDDQLLNESKVVIVHIMDLEKEILKKISNLKKYFDKKFFFLIENEDTLIPSIIAKLGFNEIYIIPNEVNKFLEKIDFTLSDIQKEASISLPKSENIFESIIGSAKDKHNLIKSAITASENSSVNILILGETGTGKGMLANAIHEYKNSSRAPFVEVNCSAIPEHLLESELFGHEKGSFTDAKMKKLGLFEIAEGGTIFLDEIAELPLNLQAKLLTSIEKKVIRRVGGVHDIPFNARIISATQRDLKQLIETNKFRTDLFYRLNLITIHLEPLRERHTDILSLSRNFIDEFSLRYKKNISRVEATVQELLLKYHWPGNIRELRNSIERAVLLSDNHVLTKKNFNLLGFDKKDSELVDVLNSSNNGSINLSIPYKSITLTNLEVIYAKEVLNKMNGNKIKTAKILGISRPTLDRLINF